MRTPICPMLLYFKGDEHKCNPNKCNYNVFSRLCTMKCLKFQEKNFPQKNEKKFLTKENR